MKTFLQSFQRYIKGTDKLLLSLCVFTSAFSCLMLLGIVNTGGVYMQTVYTQIFASGVGICGAIILSTIDYQVWGKLWKYHTILVYALILLTFLFGIQRMEGVDDKAWLMIPILNKGFQPSELLKISFIITFAYHLSKEADHINEPHTLVPICIHGMIPVLLIHFQGDDGTALVFAFIFLCMIFMAGLSWKYIAIGLGIIAVAVPIIWNFVLSPDQQMRFLSTYNQEFDVKGIGWQQYLGRVAIGSGQVWGNGLFSGQHQDIPEVYNDFIFAFVGDALGFVGCLLVVALLTAICIKLLFNAKKAPDPFGSYICVGVFAMIAIQSIINIGMCIGVLPVIGITLPFLSAGGSSVITLYMGIGLVLSCHLQSHNTLFLDK